MGSRATSVRSVAYMEKASQYQKYITLSTVFLVITSTILIFTAVILMKFYHLDKLGFWSSYFELVPYYMIILGIYTFLVGLFGTFASPSGNKAALIVFAILMTIAFLAQLGSIFTALEVRSDVERDDNAEENALDDMEKYNEDSGVASRWNDLQTDLHCCGARGFTDGYTTWYNKLNDDSAVPDSCCHSYNEDCGANIKGLNLRSVSEKIYVVGCMEIIRNKLEDDVVPMMVVYACVGVLLAIIELICVVLACAYIAQINRRTSKYDAGIWRYADANLGPVVPSHADETDIVRPSSRSNGDFSGERSSLRDTVV